MIKYFVMRNFMGTCPSVEMLKVGMPDHLKFFQGDFVVL